VVIVPACLIGAGVIDAWLSNILTLACINSIMAVSVNMVCGITGQLSLGQAGFLAIGAYSAALLNQTAGVPVLLCVLIAGAAAALAGFLIGFPVLKLTGDYLAIVTLGFGEIIRVFLVNLKGLTGGPNGFRVRFLILSLFPGLELDNFMLTVNTVLSFVLIAGVLIVIIALLRNFLDSGYGRAIISVREDEIAANASGINVFRYKQAGFVIAAFIAGIAGALYAPLNNIINPGLASYNRSIDYLIFVVLGGMGSITGSVIAAFVLTLLQELLRFLKDYRLVFYPLILILVMLFRPQGLLGTREFSFVRAAERLKAGFVPALKKGYLVLAGRETGER